MAVTSNQFIQIGLRVFNLTHIRTIDLEVNRVYGHNEVWFNYATEAEGSEILRDTEADAFRAWWNTHADVYVIELPNVAEGNEEVYQTLVEAIGRHPTAEDDPDVIDALLAVREALTRISESST